MITQLHIENFKAWADTGALRIAPLTGFFGTNSSGKTSLLQLLLLLKQTAQSLDRRQVLRLGDKDSLVDLGTFYDIVHAHRQDDTAVRFGLKWTPSNPLQIAGTKHALSLDEIAFEAAIRRWDNIVQVESFEYQGGNLRVGMRRKGQDDYDISIEGYDVKRKQGRPAIIPAPVKFYGFPDEALAEYQNAGFLADLALALEQQLGRLIYLGPLREYPQRSYLWGEERPTDVGRRGELAVAALLAANAAKMHFSRLPEPGRKRRKPVGIQERIAKWLKDMRLIDSFTLKPIASNRKDYEVRIRKTARSSEVLITDVGFGVSQILPVLVLCYYVPEGSTLILEQPEIHLHPSVQATLADVFIEVVKERRVQIILESHSEHLLHRLQRRMAEEQITPEQVSLYFCSLSETSAQIEELELDLFGNIRNWPKDFFGDQTGDLIAMTEAAMQRQLKANV